MKAELKFIACRQEKERELQERLSLQRISEETKVSLEALELMEQSHFKDISELKLGDIIKVADYLNENFHNFVVVKGSSPETLTASESDDENIDRAYTQSYCSNGEEFKFALSKSKYYSIYASIPGLIDSIANIVDTHPNVAVGCVENFNLKLTDENVLVRFFAKKNKIYIKNVLFGKAINHDTRSLYKSIYADYKTQKAKDTIDNQSDIVALVSIIENYI